MTESKTNLTDQVLADIRGKYLTHAIAVETTLDTLLISLYLPTNSAPTYGAQFRHFILGTRGLTFNSKVDVMLSALQRQMDDVEIASPKKLAERIRSLIDFRNAIAHADWATFGYRLSGPFTLFTNQRLADLPDIKTVREFSLSVYSANGLPKETKVSIPIIESKIDEEQSIVAELKQLIDQLSSPSPHK